MNFYSSNAQTKRIKIGLGRTSFHRELHRMPI
jgi:hypothetical protein